MLPKINYDIDIPDCIDPIETTLTLHDYDWMTYRVECAITTENYGKIKVKCEYVGVTNSCVTIQQIDNGECYVYKHEINSDIITAFIKQYTEIHAMTWDHRASKYELDMLVIGFYNSLIYHITDEPTKIPIEY